MIQLGPDPLKWPEPYKSRYAERLRQSGVQVKSSDSPSNDEELKAYLWDRFKIRIPDTQVCPNHSTPFRAFADAYFARHNVTVWQASRGFGGKSYLLALLGHVEADSLGAEVTILGGSGEQSTRVLEYLQKWSHAEDNVTRRTRYRSGGLVTALMASSKSARGPHPQRMRLDECFARGTLVATPAGWRDIAILNEGDRLYSWHKGGLVVDVVRKWWNRGRRGTLRCVVDGESFHATPEHPVLSGGEWIEIQKAQTIQAVSGLWKADSSRQSTRPGAGSAVHSVLSQDGRQISRSHLLAMWWSQAATVKDLPILPLCKQGSAGKSLFGLWAAVATEKHHALSWLPPEVDEHDRNGTLRSGASDSTGRHFQKPGRIPDGGTLEDIEYSLRGASSNQPLRGRFSFREDGYRGSRGLLARPTRSPRTRQQQEELSSLNGIQRLVPSDGSNASLVAKPITTEPGPTLEVFDVSTISKTFIVWPGIVVHNCDEMELKILDAAMGQPMGTATVAKQTVMSSTHHYPDGTFTEVKKRAGEKGWKIYSWCHRETSAEPDGWLTQEEIESKRGEVTASMWAAEYDLQEPSPEGRAILPEKVTLCFRKELGEFPGEAGREIIIEEPADRGEFAVYAHGCDWAKEKDWTIIDTWRIDCRPFRRVAWIRLGRMPWPMMIRKFNERVEKYGGEACHDKTGVGNMVDDYLTVSAEGIVLTGQQRADVFTDYIALIENGGIISPVIKYAEAEHRYCTNNDLNGSGHPPDSFVAGAMACRAAQLKRELSVY